MFTEIHWHPEHIRLVNEALTNVNEALAKRALESAKSSMNEKGNNIIQIFFTRWLRFQKSVTAMADNYCSVLSCLATVGAERETEGRVLLHTLMDSFGNVKFMPMANFLTDVMGII